MGRLRLIHCSDLHEAPVLGWPALRGIKPFLGTCNYFFRRRHQQDWSRVERLLAHLRAAPPDLVVITGDFTSTGSLPEFSAMRHRLQPLRDLGVKVLAVPGNHDLYHAADGAGPCHDFLEWLSDGMYGRSRAAGGVLRVDGLRLILLQQALPRPIGRADGRQIFPDMESLAKLLCEPEPTVLVGHYPLRDAGGAALAPSRALAEADLLAASVEKSAVLATLCGHIHSPFVRPLGDALEICAGSLSLTGFAQEIFIDTSARTIHQQPLNFRHAPLYPDS